MAACKPQGDSQHTAIGQRAEGFYANSIAALLVSKIQRIFAAVGSLPLGRGVVSFVCQELFQRDVRKGRIKTGNDCLLGALGDLRWTLLGPVLGKKRGADKDQRYESAPSHISIRHRSR